MIVSKLLLRPALGAVLLASVTACGASAVPDSSAGTTSAPADATPVAAVMPDVIGGNAGRAVEQMGSELDVTFKDASGHGRAVDEAAEWKICSSQPGPNEQITDFPVIFDVVKVSESCQDAAAK